MKHAREDYNRIQDPAGKIPEDEPVFLLRAQDQLACQAVAYYASLCEQAQAPVIAQKARRHADRMAAWPIKKVPDLLPTDPAMTAPTQAHRMDGAGDAEPQPWCWAVGLPADAPQDHAFWTREPDARDIEIAEIGGGVKGFIVTPLGPIAAPAVKQPQQPNPAPPMTDAALRKLWEATFSTSNPFCPCDLRTFTKTARAVEAAQRRAA